ncbi:MAG TPA: ATP-binding protein [Candidatus Krumholzibacteria bacterium]|nr:ATP-binding protein [Candidatus Krumholzibacteria bacterium]
MIRRVAGLQFRMRGQILSRVAPAFAVAGLLIAAVGWLAYAYWAHVAAVDQQSRQLRDLAAVLRERAAFAAVAGPHEGSFDGAAWALAARLDTPGNRERLAAWTAGLAAGDLDTGAARLAELGWELRFYPLLALEDAQGRPQAAVVLPVGVAPAVGAEGAGGLVLIDAGRIATARAPGVLWWGLALPDGTLVDGAADPDGTAHLAVKDAAFAAPETGGAYDHARVGPRLSPLLAGRHRDRSLPFPLVAVSPVNRQQALALGCFAAIVGLAVLALAAALLGTTRVVDTVSARLAALGNHMEGLARGDYTLRLDRGAPDEVGRLIGYFNLMAASLEEAHREVATQALGLQAALENQRLLDKAKDDFLVLISHEVRTPLTTVLGGVNFLKATIDKAEPGDRAVLERLNLAQIAGIVASSGQRLHGFLTDAIEMTAIQSGEQRLELAPVPPRELFAAALQRVAPWAESRGITVECGACGADGWHVLCDRSVLEVAVRKILDNAVVHNLDGGRVTLRETDTVPGEGRAADLVTPEMEQRLHALPDFADWSEEDVRWRIVEVHNSGRAIPRGRIDALFGKFELVGRIEHHSRGSGLSLPIAKAAVEQHGGRILVHSEEGWGTAFYLLLPTLPAAAAQHIVEGLWDDAGQGVGGRSGDEEVGVTADGAGFEVELDDDGAVGPGGGDQPGRGPDGAGRPDHEEEFAR